MVDSIHAVCSDIGSRLKQARLNANLTQEQLADKAGLSIKLVQGAEKGRCQLTTLAAYLAGLDMLTNLDAFIPKVEISPIQLAKLKGNERKRASGKSSTTKGKDVNTW